MSCKPFKDKLEAYALGLLSDKEKIAIEKHLLTCPSCEQEMKQHQQAGKLIEQAFDDGPPEYLRSKIMANLKDVKDKKGNWLYWAAPGLAGMVVLLLIIKMDPGTMMKQQAADSIMHEELSAAAEVESVAEKKAERENPAALAPAPAVEHKLLSDSARDEEMKINLGKIMEKSKHSRRSGADLSPGGGQPVIQGAADRYLSPSEDKPVKKRAGITSRTKHNAETEKADQMLFAPERQEEQARVGLKDRSLKKQAKPAKAMASVPAKAPSVAAESREEQFARSVNASKAAPAHSLQATGSGGGNLYSDDSVSEKKIRYTAGSKAASAPKYKSGKSIEQAVKKPVLTAKVTLVAIKGELDKKQVEQQLQELERFIKSMLTQKGHAAFGGVMISVAQNGKVHDVRLANELFNDENLNQYVIARIRRLNFGETTNQADGIIKINIDVRQTE